MTRVLVTGLICAFCFTTPAQGAPAAAVAKKPSLVSPKTEIGDDDLQARYTAMWEKYSADIEEASKKLQAELEKQAKSATAAGNLDLALFWKSLAKQYSQVGELRWDEPSQKKTWDDRFGDTSFPAEFGVAVKKASESYATATKDLETGYGYLVAEFTKAEKLEEALKVRGEIKELLAEKSATPEPVPKPKPKPVVKPAEKPKPVPAPPIVGLWIGDGGWGNEFLADNTTRNLNPQGQLDTVGTWKDEGQGQYSARLGSWHWQIVLKGNEIQVVRYLNGELKGHGVLKRRR